MPTRKRQSIAAAPTGKRQSIAAAPTGKRQSIAAAPTGKRQSIAAPTRKRQRIAAAVSEIIAVSHKQCVVHLCRTWRAQVKKILPQGPLGENLGMTNQ